MKPVCSICRLVVPALLILPAAAHATFNGPAGAACSGTMSNGQSYSGVQSWTTHNGSGYWSCATIGTRGFSNPQTERSAAPRAHRDVKTRGSKGEQLIIKHAP